MFLRELFQKHSLIKFETNNEVAMNHFKPEPIKSNIPKWYKDMELEFEDELTAKNIVCDQTPYQSNLTVKSCIPVRDYLTSGYLIRSAADIKLSVDSEDRKQTCCYYSKSSNAISSHSHKQMSIEIGGRRYAYIKFTNPWVVRTEPGYSCLFYQPEYLFEDRFRLLPGIVDTDKHDVPVNFPGYLLKEGSFDVLAGTPLMCVFPFKRDNFKAEYQLKRLGESVVTSSFKNAYLKLFHSKKHYS